MKTRDVAELALYEATRPRNPSVLEPRVEIHMNAPTAADSARLYGELKDKAEKSVTEVIRVGDTQFECVVHVWHDHMNDERIFRAVYSVNGRKLETTIAARPSEDRRLTFDRLRDAVAKDMAAQILSAAFLKSTMYLPGGTQ